MRKFQLLFTLCLFLSGVTVVKAQVEPRISDDDTVYEYYMTSVSNMQLKIFSDNNANVPGFGSSSDRAKVKLVKAGNDSNGDYYQLIVTNYEGHSDPIVTTAAVQGLYIAYSGEGATNDTWYLKQKDGDTDAWYLALVANESLAFTAYGSKQIGLFNYTGGNVNNQAYRWRFYPANDEAIEAELLDKIDITSGYYKIHNVRQSTMYLKNDYAQNSENKTLQCATPTANQFIWKVDIDGINVTLLNAQGTPLKVQQTNTGVFATYETMKFIAKMGEKTYVFDNYLNGNNHTTDNAAIQTWPGDGTANGNQWVFEQVTEGTVYNVDIVNGESGSLVRRSDTNEEVFDGGFFVVASGDEPTFTASDIDGYKASVEVEGTTITVTYTVVLDELKEALSIRIGEAREALAKTGVGYPAEGSVGRTGLSEAITIAEGVYASETTTADELGSTMTSLTNAVAAFKVEVDIQMPEDGKAYTITSVTQTGVKRYMNYAEAGYGLVDVPESGPLPETAVLICHKVGEGQYVFVNTAGKYFMWKGSNAGQNGNKGYVDGYDVPEEGTTSNTVLTISKMTVVGQVSGTQESLFGYVVMKGNRNDGSNPNYFVIKSAGGYDQAADPYFNANHTSALLIEEVVDFSNKVAFTKLNNENCYVATYSAPYPTVIPEGVKAYAVTGETEGAVTTESLGEEGTAIPANTGVLLVVEEETDIAVAKYMAPAADDTPKSVSADNKLKAASASRTAETAAYVLDNHEEEKGVAFYPLATETTPAVYSAYLELAGTSATYLTLTFDDGPTTGITGIRGAENGNAAIYDLSGRRILKPVKGGLYIKDGAKYVQK